MTLLDNGQLNTMTYREWQARYGLPRGQTLAFTFFPLLTLLTMAVEANFFELVNRFVAISHEERCINDHRRFIHFAMVHFKSLAMLRYFIEQEGANINYCDRERMCSIWDCLPDVYQAQIVDIVRYVYQEAVPTIFPMSEKTFHKLLFMSSADILLIDAILCYGYGYQMEFTSYSIPEPTPSIHASKRARHYESIRSGHVTATMSRPCQNINELRLNNNTMNPLIFVVASFHYNVLQESSMTVSLVRHFLEHHRANINAQDSLGNTALHYAVLQQKFAVIGSLMKYNADMHVKNHEGESAFTLAGENTSIFSRY